uniref:Uncharacterized protein n=1 Tax=Coccidioides posadasii RMSCC 3488 TaxID=454284 RepID=A0A0J6IKL4_COCPO|nr:hypothetical protein CPAG_08786 [Coccidioides posadasii RMSCC 3488]
MGASMAGTESTSIPEVEMQMIVLRNLQQEADGVKEVTLAQSNMLG